VHRLVVASGGEELSGDVGHRTRRDRPRPDHHAWWPLDEASHAYALFKNEEDNCEKVLLKP
jgi:threonine dehydrogenase-like Zn-dependent dehydrogenase